MAATRCGCRRRSTAFPSEDATADTARVMAAIEAMVRAAPAQYLWIHRRFKRQPDGSVDLYATDSAVASALRRAAAS